MVVAMTERDALFSDETLEEKLDRIGAEAEAAEATVKDKDFRDLMYREAQAAEDAPDEDDGSPLPAHVEVSRPNRARSKVLQVRLNPDEFDAVERIAAGRGLPMSTVARERLLQMIAEDAGP
jgi:hypothetical protein